MSKPSITNCPNTFFIIVHSFNCIFSSLSCFACVQIRHNPLSGGYCGEVPPLPIPNREVKLTCADGTAMQCGRVGSRLLLSRASDFERFLRLFLFPTDFTDLHRFLTCSVWDFADGRSFFYFFTFKSPFYLYQVYKMLMNCGFSFINSAKLRTKMLFSTKKNENFSPPIHFFLLPLPPENANYHVLRLIFIITYLYKRNKK